MEAELLCHAWLELALQVRQNRFLRNLQFNQMVICSILAKAPDGMTAADLCRKTYLLKSQMNKELRTLEDKGLITRTINQEDRRKTIVRFVETTSPNLFTEERNHAFELFNHICEEMGPENARHLATLLSQATKIASPYINQEKQHEHHRSSRRNHR